MQKKLIIGIVILVIIGVFIISKRAKNSAADTQIQTAPVTVQTFTKTIQSSGKTKAKKQVDLKFQISGKLIWVGVKEGDTVKQGQVIAQLDSREVQKNLTKTLTDYSEQRNTFEETWRVTYSGRTPDQALTDTVKRILQKNQWDLEKSVLDVELKSLALEYSSLVTPISGIVTHIDTPYAGVNITPAGSVFEVVDPSTLVFEANIDEIDVGNLENGQTATINLDAYPESTFSGVVSNVAYSSVLSGGGATVFPVEVQFDNSGLLRIGLNGDVSISVLSVPDSILIPLEAVREDKSEKYVFKKTSKGYIKTVVTTGNQNDTDVIVTSGLTAGDEIVIKGFSQIPKSAITGKP